MKLLTDDIYDLRALKKYAIILGAFTVLSYLTRGYIFAVLPVMVFFAVSRGKLVDLLLWVMVLSFTGVSNPFIFPKTSMTFVIARLSLFAVAGILAFRVFGRRNALIVSPFIGVFFYIGWAAIVSLQGYEPIVSYLKIVLFIPIYIALYAVANEITASTRVNAKAVRSAILAIVSLVVFGSFALIPFPGLSQFHAFRAQDAAMAARMAAEGTSLFMGLTNQPQALGPMLGVLLTVVFGDLVFSVKRWEPIYVALLGIGAVLLFKTSSRTGMGTFIAGIAMVMWLFSHARAVDTRWKGKVVSALFLFGIVGFVAMLAVPKVRNKVLGFMLKVNTQNVEVQTSDITLENLSSSRQMLVESAWENFKRKPFTGNGFQVSAEMQFEKRSTLMEYMSAPIEKGVWVTAILEEGGLMGFLLFAGFLVVCFALLVKRHAYIGAGALWVFAVVNLGEFNFFSMSYTGGFEWALVFAAVILDGQRMKNVGLEVWEVPMEVVIEEVGMDEWVKRKA